MMNPLFSISVGLLRQSLESSLRLGAAAANVTSTLFYASRKVPVEYAPIGVLRLDHSLHVLSSNPAARDLIGSQLTSGSSLHQILSYDSVEALLARIGECHAQGTPFATKVELPPADSGSHLPIPISVHIDQLQKGPGRRSRLVATLTQLPLASLQVISDTRTRLLESCACEQDPEKLLSSILNELRTIVPFDVATFHEYTVDEDNKTRVSRIRFVFDPGEPSFRWPVRWTQVEPRVHQLATGERPWIGDLEEFLKEIGSDTLQNAPNIVAARKRGLKSFLILALKEANTVSAALTLSSQKSNFFGAYERELLDAVDMEKVLQLVRAAYRRQADVFSLELGRLFHSGAEPPQIAKQFVEKLAKEFDWEYVGIFRVAHTRGQFELVEQYDKAANLRLSPNYTQSLSAGVLGNVLREGRAIRIPDVNIDPAPFGYIKLSEARSCLCYPIRIRDKVEWILDCESSQVSGFGAADQRALEAVINGLETTLSFWFESRLNQALLGRIHQGVVVVDESGGIERLNEAAQLLLGLAIGEDAKQRTLYDFGADEQAKAVLRRERDASDRHIRLRGNDGVERRALVSAYFAPEAFNRWIWLLTDVADQRWQVGLHYLRALAQEVAGETRGPLLLANSLVNSAGDLLKQPEILDQRGLPTKAVEFLERASRHLAKADITYERLASLLRTYKGPDRRRSISVAAFLAAFKDSLPEKDRQALVLRTPCSPLEVNGLPEIEAAFRSLLGYLLAFREHDFPVECEVTQADGLLTVNLSTKQEDGADPPNLSTLRDIIEESERGGRNDAALAFDAARKIFERAGGELRQRQSSNKLTFIVKLPGAKS